MGYDVQVDGLPSRWVTGASETNLTGCREVGN